MDDSENPLLKAYATAAEAMEILGVRRQTLYAYVSRGWIGSIPQPGRKNRLYSRADLQRVQSRSQARAGHGAVAAAAMNWGEPIIPTSITEITPEGPRYRGRLAVDLARMRASFESVAELLWTGMWDDMTAPQWPVTKPWAELNQLTNSLASLQGSDQILEVFALVTLQLGVCRGSIAERVRSGRTLDAGRQIIQTLVGCFGLATARKRYVPMQSGQTVTQGLMQALSVETSSENHEAIESMLTLLADHELSPGTLSARVSASSGSTLHSCIASAICASSGVEVGRLYARVYEFLAGESTKFALLKRAMELRERGAAVPGFVHPLYRDGDPRAKYLLEIVHRRGKQTRQLAAAYDFVQEMAQQHNLFPRHEIAVVMLTQAMGLPKQIPGALFVLARTAGWLAHVQEQRLSGTLMRPRARFVGTIPK